MAILTKREKNSFFILITLGIMINSCNLGVKEKNNFSEGKVKYKITYPSDYGEHSMSFLFPKEMTLFFKNNDQRASFKGSMSLYSLDFIHYSQSDSFFTLLQVLDKKLFVPSTKSGSNFLFQNYSNEKVTFTNEPTRKIKGFICEKAEIKPKNNKFNNITIWFTREIGINNPNRNTPFEKIPGVMLYFEVTYQDIVFNFTADKITQTTIPDDLFRVPENYTQSSISEIEGLIKAVIN